MIIQTSSDLTRAKITFDSSDSGVFSAIQIEDLISALGATRQKLFPPVSQTDIPLENQGLVIDAHDPLFSISKLDQNHDALMLSIGFHNLGWRSVALSRDDAARLASTLLEALRDH